MVNALHYDGSFSWPGGRRMAVMLTFDFQGGEDIRPKDGKIDHEKYTQAEYGPNTAIYRILRILEEEGVRATFLTCGAIAERYPEFNGEMASTSRLADKALRQAEMVAERSRLDEELLSSFNAQADSSLFHLTTSTSPRRSPLGLRVP